MLSPRTLPWFLVAAGALGCTTPRPGDERLDGSMPADARAGTDGNSHGNSDHGEMDDSRAQGDTFVTDDASTSPPALGAGSLAAGDKHACAITGGGGVACWGANAAGQLGDGSTMDRRTAVAVAGLTDATALAAGTNHTCALRASGAVVCWGTNEQRQLGTDGADHGSARPVDVQGVGDATQLAAGANHTCALRASGAVVCWGANDRRQLGGASDSSGPGGGDASRPIAVPGLAGVTQIAARNNFSCALLATGEARCWGDNSDGQLGIGAPMGTYAPTAVTMLRDATVLAGGWLHACALTRTGAALCWGRDDHGQLGDGTTGPDRLVPTTAMMPADSVALAAGSKHTCALTRGGAVQCWGANDKGQLGDGSMTEAHAPVSAAGLSGATALAAGADFTCARDAAGVLCWGANDKGQLGAGDMTPRLTPTRVSGP